MHQVYPVRNLGISEKNIRSIPTKNGTLWARELQREGVSIRVIFINLW